MALPSQPPKRLHKHEVQFYSRVLGDASHESVSVRPPKRAQGGQSGLWSLDDAEFWP